MDRQKQKSGPAPDTAPTGYNSVFTAEVHSSFAANRL